jgi:hypothetical protein
MMRLRLFRDQPNPEHDELVATRKEAVQKVSDKLLRLDEVLAQMQKEKVDARHGE